MQPDNKLIAVLDALRQHIPSDATWLPFLVAGAAALVGLAFMLRGARLVPGVIALGLLVGGGYAGARLGPALNLYPWVAGLAGAGIGAVLGLILFRLWLAIQVAGFLAGAALLLYGAQVLQPAINSFQSQGLDPTAPTPISLQDPGQAPVADAPWHVTLGKLWTHLGHEVPTFQPSFFAIVISTGIAGLVFAGLMPKAARSFWAATVGTSLFLLAIATILSLRWPMALEQMGRWGLIASAGLWAVALVINLADQLDLRPKKTRSAPAEPARAGT